MTAPDSIAAGRIVTFYSYKGGTGRSMALANVACLLARREAAEGRDVLAIDWDLEAPGLHRYLDSPRQDGKERLGLIELFETLSGATDATKSADADILGQLDLDRFIRQTGVRGLSFMAAGRFDESYAARVTRFDWYALHKKAPALIPALANRLAERYAWVLIDSRTGISDTSGICTMLMPELLVVVFTPNLQSLTGLVQLVRDAAGYRRHSHDVRPLVVFPLPSRIEPARPALLERWRLGSAQDGLEGFQHQFEALFADVYGLPGCDLSEYFDEVQVQHAPDFAYGEQIAVQVEETDTRLSLRRSYETFTERLVNLPGPWVDPRAAAAERELAELCVRSMTALQEGDYRLAQSLLVRAADLHRETSAAHSPPLAQALLRLGQELLDDGELADAEVVLRLAVEVAERAFGPGDLEVAPYLDRLADALASSGRGADALNLVEQALRARLGALGDDHLAVADTYERLGSLLLAAGRLGGAREAFHRSLDIRQRVLGPEHPSAAASLERLADVAIAEGRFEDAGRHLTRAMELSQGSGESEQRARILNRLGALYLTTRQPEQAEEWFREAAGADRSGDASAALTRADSLDGLARIATARGDYRQARALYEEAQLAREEQLGPEHPDTLRSVVNLGDLAMAEKDWMQASRQYRRAYSLLGRSRHLADHPLAAEVAGRLGTAALAQNDLQEALDWYARAIDLDPTLGWAIAERGDTYRLMGRYEEALADLSKAIELEATNASMLASRGETYRLMGRYEEALADFSRALELTPQTPWIIGSRGQVYQAMSRYEEALADLTRAIDLDPTLGWAIAERDRIAQELGE